jgi:hypothetical protein
MLPPIPTEQDAAQPPMNPMQMMGGTAEAEPQQGQASAQEIHSLLMGLAGEVDALAQRFPAFAPFGEQIGQLFTEGFFAIQEQLDAAAPEAPTPRYL